MLTETSLALPLICTGRSTARSLQPHTGNAHHPLLLKVHNCFPRRAAKVSGLILMSISGDSTLELH